MDLVSASSSVLEPLPRSSQPSLLVADQEGGGIDGRWVEEMEERCERGDVGALFTLGHYYMYLTTKNEYKVHCV